MTCRCLLLSLLALVMLAGSAWGAAGVQGRVAWRGELIPGVTVRAYRSIPDIAAGSVVAMAAPTGLDGTYRLELPPGSYYLTARDGSGPLRPGNYFCYYSGAPVQVNADAFRNVGFNLVRVPLEAPAESAPRSGLRGEITFQDEPLERSYLYVYREADKGFKGPGYLIQPVEKGRFRVNLPPGTYWLLARKRVRGGQFGPIETGDYFNYYPGNPVTVAAGEVREVRIETITRLSMLEDDPGAAFVGVRGRLLDQAGRPVARLHVFVYRDAAMTGTPDFFSAPSTADGRFEVALPTGGPYYLLARQEFGGPAAEGELQGRFGGATPTSVRIEPRGETPEVTIHVAPKNSQ